MREILFRGKQFDGEWIFGIYLDENHIGIFHDDTETKDCEIDVFQIIPETLGEYTGLTDKNGKRIFEGDIIKGKEKATYAIRYSDATASFYAKAALPQRMLPCMAIGTMKYYAVIGNIHDNPELLSEMTE